MSPARRDRHRERHGSRAGPAKGAGARAGPAGSGFSAPGSRGKGPHGAGASARRVGGGASCDWAARHRAESDWALRKAGGGWRGGRRAGREEGRKEGSVGSRRGGRELLPELRWVSEAAALCSAARLPSRPCALRVLRPPIRPPGWPGGAALCECQRPGPLQRLAPGLRQRGKPLRAWGKIFTESALTRCH